MKLYLFLRELIWTSIFSVLALLGTLIAAFTNLPTLTLGLGLTAVTLAILSSSSSSNYNR
jgi:hypothetical protein